jgi:hypothetical protein
MFSHFICTSSFGKCPPSGDPIGKNWKLVEKKAAVGKIPLTSGIEDCSMASAPACMDISGG